MYSSAIILKFENAGIFPKTWKEKDGVLQSYCSGMGSDDRIYDNGRAVRNKDQWVEQDIGNIHYSFVANVLRVLVGRRPVPKFRKSSVQLDELDNIAKRSFVKITSSTKKYNEKDSYITEKITTRKCMENSWSNSVISWMRIKNSLPIDLYQEFVSVATSICGTDSETILFNTVADMLCNSGDSRVETLIQKVRAVRFEPLAKLLLGEKSSAFSQSGYKGLGPFLRVTVTKAVNDIIRLDGYLCIPVKDEDVQMFKDGCGVATIFDGGIVRIEEVINLEYSALENITINYLQVQQ